MARDMAAQSTINARRQMEATSAPVKAEVKENETLGKEMGEAVRTARVAREDGRVSWKLVREAQGKPHDDLGAQITPGFEDGPRIPRKPLPVTHASGPDSESAAAAVVAFQ